LVGDDVVVAICCCAVVLSCHVLGMLCAELPHLRCAVVAVLALLGVVVLLLRLWLPALVLYGFQAWFPS
jgi:hypothetical protein